LQPLKDKNDNAVAVDLLRAFAQQVASLINTGGASVGVELGHLVNQGQEYRVVVRAPQIHLVDILLRAFIPIDGFPVVLDMFAQGETSCASEDDLVKALVGVSKQPEVRQRLTNIRQALLDPDLRDPDAGGPKSGEPKTKKSSKKSAAA
jgi:hypothetical protein